jgi:NADPH:quinone reductase-like Zn-dependent oxidoreductase
MVIAGVLKRQLEAASSLGAYQVLATDDDDAMASLPPLGAVADAVGRETAKKLLAKVKKGGVFASVLGTPQNAKDYPGIAANIYSCYCYSSYELSRFSVPCTDVSAFGWPRTG